MAAPAALRALDGLSSRRVLGAIQSVRPADAREFCAGVARGTVRALLPQHLRAGDAHSQLSAHPMHAGRLRLCALRVCRARARLCPRSPPADDHAGRAHRRELSHHVLARPCRYHSGDRAAVRRFRLLLLRPTFKSVPRELDDAARVEGAGPLQVLWRVYVPLAKPVYLAYALVSVSYHWNNFLWPLIVTNSVEARPLTVGLQVFASTDQGIDWSVICAATLMTSAPLLFGFLLFQRQFVQSFMRAGIR